MSQVNHLALELAKSGDAVELVCYVDAEMDEMWLVMSKRRVSLDGYGML